MNCLRWDCEAVRSEEIGSDSFVIETSWDKLTPGVSRAAVGPDLALAGWLAKYKPVRKSLERGGERKGGEK